MGARIEMTVIVAAFLFQMVAPLAGAWIEIFGIPNVVALGKVAPLAGAWIEITEKERG